MYNNEMSQDMAHRLAIEDAAIMLRIHQLQKGLIQYTDSSIAERMQRMYGTDIRYIHAWKKWIIWDGTHWKVDSGELIQSLGLKLVRNIYDEVRKTGDYRERLEIGLSQKRNADGRYWLGVVLKAQRFSLVFPLAPFGLGLQESIADKISLKKVCSFVYGCLYWLLFFQRKQLDFHFGIDLFSFLQNMAIFRGRTHSPDIKIRTKCIINVA